MSVFMLLSKAVYAKIILSVFDVSQKFFSHRYSLLIELLPHNMLQLSRFV